VNAEKQRQWKLAETEYSLTRVTRLANARAAVDRADPRYFEAVDRAFAALELPPSNIKLPPTGTALPGRLQF
jgi:hypothetical protein